MARGKREEPCRGAIVLLTAIDRRYRSRSSRHLIIAISLVVDPGLGGFDSGVLPPSPEGIGSTVQDMMPRVAAASKGLKMTVSFHMYRLYT